MDLNIEKTEGGEVDRLDIPKIYFHNCVKHRSYFRLVSTPPPPPPPPSTAFLVFILSQIAPSYLQF
jgi:hypothetical protein